jgi:hypothetical protein
VNLRLARLQTSGCGRSQGSIGGKNSLDRVHKNSQTTPPAGTGNPMVDKAQQDTAHHGPPAG